MKACKKVLQYATVTQGGIVMLRTDPAMGVQWNLPIKDTLTKGHLSNENAACCPNDIELCTNLPLN